MRHVAAAALALVVAGCGSMLPAGYSPPDIPADEAATVSGDGVGTLLFSIDALNVYDSRCPTAPCRAPFPKRYKLAPGRHVIFVTVAGLVQEPLDTTGAVLSGPSSAGRPSGGHCLFQLDAEARHAYSILPVLTNGKVTVNNRLLIRDTVDGDKPAEREVDAICS